MCKNGKTKNGVQKYICPGCRNTISETTNTIIHHSKLSFEVWSNVIDNLLNGFSLRRIAEENNISVLADHITYYSDTKTITAQGNVKINQNGKFIATADEAFVDSGFSVFKIKGNTVTRIYESNDSKTSGTEGL